MMTISRTLLAMMLVPLAVSGSTIAHAQADAFATLDLGKTLAVWRIDGGITYARIDLEITPASSNEVRRLSFAPGEPVQLKPGQTGGEGRFRYRLVLVPVLPAEVLEARRRNPGGGAGDSLPLREPIEGALFVGSGGAEFVVESAEKETK